MSVSTTLRMSIRRNSDKVIKSLTDILGNMSGRSIFDVS